MSATDVGTKTGNKEKRKASNHICRPVEKWHWFVDRRTKESDGRPWNKEDSSRWCPSELEAGQVKSSQVNHENILIVLSSQHFETFVLLGTAKQYYVI